MTKAEIIKAARESLRADSLRPGRDRFAEMVTQGVIDARGKVLVKGPMVMPPTDAENLYGKAFPRREGETIHSWLRRGARESGEAFYKFKQTLFRMMRVAIRNELYGHNPAELLSGHPPEPVRLDEAYKSVHEWATRTTKEAGLEQWMVELVSAYVFIARECFAQGPNVTELIVYRMSILIDPSGKGAAEVLARTGDLNLLGNAAEPARQWALDAIIKMKDSPDNPFGDDDEAIAGAILAKLRPGDSETKPWDPWTIVTHT